MTSAPTVQFGMMALATALRAKSGRLETPERLALARCALVHAATIPFCCAEVEFFLATVDGNPVAAAQRLICFAEALVPTDQRAAPEFDWQRRADLR